MYYYELGRVIQDEHQREIERCMRMRAEREAFPPGHSIRQAIGRGLIRFGSLLAAEGPHEPGRLRSPGQAETQP